MKAQNVRSWLSTGEQKKARARAYKKENPEISRACNSRRRSLKTSSIVERVSAKDLLAILKRQKFKCSWCGASIKKGAQMDHVTPLAKGGAHSVRNIVGSCASCNLRKNAKDPVTWAQELGLLI